MDNKAKVNGQKLNELAAVKASFVQLLLFLWRDNDFEIYRDACPKIIHLFLGVSSEHWNRGIIKHSLPTVLKLRYL